MKNQRTIIALAVAAANITDETPFHLGQRAGYQYAALLLQRYDYAHVMNNLESFTQPHLIESAYDYGLHVAVCCAALLILQHWMYSANDMAVPQ